MNWDLIIKAIGLFAIFIAVVNFYAQKKIKRGEWLKSLFEKFYEGQTYKEVRKWIDFEMLESELTGDDDHIKEEKLSDFLNFFEFIATLEKLDHLEMNEIEDLFLYYLRKIKDSSLCSEYIVKYSFKNLRNLLYNLSSNEKQ